MIESDEHIAGIVLDEGSIKHRSPEVKHERDVALADLIDENIFEPAGMRCGPYQVKLGIEEHRLVFDIRSMKTGEMTRVTQSVQPLKMIIRDYFMICGSYYEALKMSGAGKIEAIDMGRRGMHDEGSEILQELLKDKINVDFPTARRLFTLICVLHIK